MRELAKLVWEGDFDNESNLKLVNELRKYKYRFPEDITELQAT